MESRLTERDYGVYNIVNLDTDKMEWWAVSVPHECGPFTNATEAQRYLACDARPDTPCFCGQHAELYAETPAPRLTKDQLKLRVTVVETPVGPSLLQYVIDYLRDEVVEPREHYDPNDEEDVRRLFYQALDAHKGGAR